MQRHTQRQWLITDTLHVYVSHLSPLNSADWLCSLLVNGEHCIEVQRELNRLINAASCSLQARQQLTFSVNAWKMIGGNISAINVKTIKKLLRFRWWPINNGSYTNQWQLITSRRQSRKQEVNHHICRHQTWPYPVSLNCFKYMSRARWTFHIIFSLFSYWWEKNVESI